jgi:uncharacterized membrane protein YhhN
MTRSSSDRPLFVLSFLAAAAWLGIVLVDREAGLVAWAKGLPVLLLGIAAWRRQEALLAFALILHAVGDVAIQFHFLIGMALFLAGHLLYVTLFRSERGHAHGAARVRIAVLAVVAVATLAFLLPRLAGVMAAAVPLYAVALVAMAISAQVSLRGQPWVWIGACSFVVSDLLLALHLFNGEPQGIGAGRFLVWPTYWLAQAAITWGWLMALQATRARSGEERRAVPA